MYPFAIADDAYHRKLLGILANFIKNIREIFKVFCQEISKKIVKYSKGIQKKNLELQLDPHVVNHCIESSAKQM